MELVLGDKVDISIWGDCLCLINISGDTFDIHGGGQDLIFPHHENEIAQSKCGCGGDYARYWIHNGYINVNRKNV